MDRGQMMTNEWTDCIDERLDEETTEGQKNERTSGWTERRTKGQVGGRTEE